MLCRGQKRRGGQVREPGICGGPQCEVLFSKGGHSLAPKMIYQGRKTRWTGACDGDSLEESRRDMLNNNSPHGVAQFCAILVITNPLLPAPRYVFQGQRFVAPGMLQRGRKKSGGLEREKTHWELWKNSGQDPIGKTSPTALPNSEHLLH